MCCALGGLSLAAPKAKGKKPQAKDAKPAAAASADLKKWMKRSNAVFSVFEAAEAGDTAKLSELLKAGESPAAVDELGRTALHLAAAAGKDEAAEMLLQAGADCLAKDADGKIPSQLAKKAELRKLLQAGEEKRAKELQVATEIDAGNEDFVAQAASMGVNPNALVNNGADTLLTYALNKGRMKAAEALVDAGADPNWVGPSAKTAMHVAAVKAGPELISKMVAKGGKTDVQQQNGATAIHEALWYGRNNVLKSLLPGATQPEFAPSTKKKGFGPPLIMAVMRGNTTAMGIFVEAGADVNAALYKDEPLLIVAVKAGKPEAVKFLLEKGANVSAKDKTGKTAADYAADKPQILKLLK